MGKFDIKNAYRNIPVHVDDRRLLGMRWKGKYYVDLALSFGLRSAPAIFSSVGDVLQYILTNSVDSSSIGHYLDDFLSVCKNFEVLSSETVSVATSEFNSILSYVRILAFP